MLCDSPPGLKCWASTANPLVRGARWCFNTGRPFSRSNLTAILCFSTVNLVPSQNIATCREEREVNVQSQIPRCTFFLARSPGMENFQIFFRNLCTKSLLTYYEILIYNYYTYLYGVRVVIVNVRNFGNCFLILSVVSLEKWELECPTNLTKAGDKQYRSLWK